MSGKSLEKWNEKKMDVGFTALNVSSASGEKSFSIFKKVKDFSTFKIGQDELLNIYNFGNRAQN